jgi:hypothetical protein
MVGPRTPTFCCVGRARGEEVGGSSGIGPPIPTSVSTSSGSCRIEQRPLVLPADQQLAFAAKISRSRRASAATHATTCTRKADMRNAARCHSSYTHRSGCCPSRPGTCRPGVDRGLFGRLRAPLLPDLKPVGRPASARYCPGHGRRLSDRGGRRRHDQLWVTPSESLAVTHPDVAAQWHPTRNGTKTPNHVSLRAALRGVAFARR